MRKRIKQLKSQLGTLNAGLYLLNRLFSHFSSSVVITKYYFVVQMFHNEKLLAPNRGKNIKTKIVNEYNQYELPLPRPVSVIKDRFSQGAICIAANKRDEFAGCFWYIQKSYQEDEVRSRFDLVSDQSVWDFDVYVEPKYRLSPVFLKLWDDASEKLQNEGYIYSISRISAFNPMSLASHKRMGAEMLGFALYLKLWNVQFMVSDLFPFVHLSMSAKSYPVFKLTPNPK